MAVHEKNRKIVTAVRKYAPAVLAALWAAPFIHYGSTKRAVLDRTDAVCIAGGGIDGGAGRPALPDGRTNGILVGRDVPVAPVAASSTPATTVDGRFRVAVRPATNDCARPAGVALLDPDGTVGVWKLYQRVERSTNGVVWLNGNLVE